MTGKTCANEWKMFWSEKTKTRDTKNDKCDTNKTIKTELHTEQKKRMEETTTKM